MTLLKAFVQSFVFYIAISEVSAAHLLGNGLSYYPTGRGPSLPGGFPPSIGPIGNFRVRRQSIGGPFQSSRLRLSRFPSFSTGRQFSQIRGLSQRNPLLTRRISGLRSSPFFSAPITSEFSTRSNPGRVVQLGRSTGRLRTPSSSSSSSSILRSRGGLRSFGTRMGVPRRSSLGLSSLNSRLRQQLAAGYTGTGTRDDPIRLISSRPATTRAVSSVRRTSQRSRISTSGRRAPVSRTAQTAGSRNNNNDEEVIALFGFENPTLGGLGIDETLPQLSETIDAPVGVKRTPIKKATIKSTPIVHGDVPKVGQVLKKAKISGLELHGAGFATESKKKIIASSKSETVATKSEIKPMKIAKEIAKHSGNIIKDTSKVVSEFQQTELKSKMLTKVAPLTQPVDFPVSVAADPLSEVMPIATESKMIPAAQENIIPIAKGESFPVATEGSIAPVAQSDVPTTADKTAVIDTTIADADQVNININADTAVNNNNNELAPVDVTKPIVSEPHASVDAANKANDVIPVEPIGVYVESQTVNDIHHTGVILDPTNQHSLEAAIKDTSVIVDTPKTVAAELVEHIPTVDQHTVGGISVIADSKPSSGLDIPTTVDVGIDTQVNVADIVVDAAAVSAVEKVTDHSTSNNSNNNNNV